MKSLRTYGAALAAGIMLASLLQSHAAHAGAKIPAPIEVAAPAPILKPVAAKKMTITCVKGKTTKKVTAVKPKCPAGYKKK